MTDTLVNGMMLGANYALLAVGYSLVFGILRLLTLAHGEIFIGTGVLTLLVITELDAPFWLALPVAIAIGAVLSVLTDVASFRPVGYSRPIAAAVSTIGFGLIIHEVVIWSRGSTTVVPLPETLLDFGDWRLLGVLVSPEQAVALLLAVVATAGVVVFIRRSRWGLAMRAFAIDPTAVQLLGVPVRRLTTLTLAIAGALAGIAAMLLAARGRAVDPQLGLELGLIGLAVMTIGGLGSIPGAAAAGLALGIAEAFTDYLAPAGYQAAAPWLLLILVLLVRPQGLLGDDADV